MDKCWLLDFRMKKQLKKIKFHTRGLSHNLWRLAVEVSFIIGLYSIQK